MKLLFIVLLILSGIVSAVAKPEEPHIPVDVIIVLAIDSSGSIDDQEFEVQREGYAKALVSDEVVEAIANGTLGQSAIALVYWSGPNEQSTIVGWRVVQTRDDLRRIASLVRTIQRPYTGSTSVSQALKFCIALILSSPYQSSQKIIDISSDGISDEHLTNTGPASDDFRIRSKISYTEMNDIRQFAKDNGIVINALPMVLDGPLIEYYEKHVATGFTLPVPTQGHLEETIAFKFVKEMQIAIYNTPTVTD